MDIRERTNPSWLKYDEQNMQIIIDYGWEGENEEEGEAIIPAKYVVCEVCRGKGTHVNPSIDSNGISVEEFYEDPDFMEEYFSGVYDVQCNECCGKRVVLDIDTNKATEEQIKLLADTWDSWYSYQAEREAEIRMGA